MINLTRPLPRRRFLATATLAAAGSSGLRPARVRAAGRPTLSFGLVADPQYADVDPAGTRFYRQSIGKLTEAVAHFNGCDLAFGVNLGDLIDRHWARTWNGAVSDRQLQWFEATCQTAAQAGQRVIVMAHHPVHPADDHNAWNFPQLLEVLSRNRNVVAWFSGHNHAGALGVFEGVPCLTLRGMVETERTNAYAVVHLHADRLEVVGHGREPSRELPFRGA